jgi:hypothetical protein
MSYILQKVKRIREMLEMPSLTKPNPDDQLSFEGTSTLLQTGYFEQDEQTPFSLLTNDHGPSDYNPVDPCLFQGWPTLPLTKEDIISEITWTKGKDDQSISSNHENIALGDEEVLLLQETCISDSALMEPRRILLEQERDANWGDCLNDASDISEDWDDYCSTQGDDCLIQRGIGLVKWEEHVFGTSEPHDQINNVGHVIEGPQICLNVTPEEHRERMKEAARKARMEIINNFDPKSKEKLAKREFQVYRQKKLSQPTLTILVITQTKPSPSNILPPKTPKNERVDLKFDFEGALSKMHVTIPLREVIKVLSVKERFDNFFKGSDGPMDPPIMLQADHFRVQYDEHSPFFMTLLMNNKSLNNCMLDSGVGANMMSLKVMQQLGLKVT